ncbi:ABC transporter ATP-binding protein [Aestuariispira insulae]|uniref:Peptide/nickel transport system ATP-binding protein n=1 Tax=Aestuariispira insulae TaxID=1461337 RepID=A0A3D9HWH5_9PROT|nr:ATP-binding cassette domain-containing protein [Aestuariispira insulae]RED53760.1 peptide/nickel transport system ATP-binding protein [Aestuariispira insulae]
MTGMADEHMSKPDFGQDGFFAVQGLSKTFTKKSWFQPASHIHALRNVSLALSPGRAMALVGESGSGKSTCAKVMAGIYGPSEGRVVYRGRNLIAGKRRADRKVLSSAIQMVFQDPFAALNPAHTIEHHLKRPIRLHGLEQSGLDQKDRISELLELVQLDPEITRRKYPHELSGGQRQRINIARALAVGAEVIIADEPTSMLDVSIRLDILKLLKQLKEEKNIALLYITHDIATARYVAEETAVIYAGQLVEWGPTAAVIDDPQHPYTQLLLAAVPQAGVPFNQSGDRSNGDRVRAAAALDNDRIIEISPGHFVRDCRI